MAFEQLPLAEAAFPNCPWVEIAVDSVPENIISPGPSKEVGLRKGHFVPFIRHDSPLENELSKGRRGAEASEATSGTVTHQPQGKGPEPGVKPTG